MKKVIFGLIATVLFSINTTAQTTKESWLKMIDNHKVNVERILNSEKPKDVDLKKFKEQIVLGERKLSEKSKNEIILSSIPLKTYASEFTRKNNILVDSDDELIFYAGFYPDFPINDDFNEALGGLTADEVWDCAVDAVGLGFVTAIGAAGIKATGITVFTKAITKFITKFAGPIGGAITVADFAFCLYGQSLD
jgi:hypothetical protein